MRLDKFLKVSRIIKRRTVAKEVADRVIFMADGEVLEDSRNVRDFFENPNEVRAQQFISKVINH